MKAVRLLEYGGQLVFNDIPTPTIACDEVLVKVKSTAVNHLDLVKAAGTVRQILPIDLPWIPGHEFSTFHLVMRQMHAIDPLIDEHGHRSVRARVRNILGHFFHEERIANNKANHSGCIATSFFAQNRAVIKLHEEHQSRLAQAFLDCAFQLDKGMRFLG